MDLENPIKFKPLSSIYQLLLNTVNDQIEVFEFSFSEALIWLSCDNY